MPIWTWIISEIDHLTMDYGDPFLRAGQDELLALGVVVLIIYSATWALRGEGSLVGLMHFIGLYIVAQTALTCYNTPLPFSSSSFKHLFPDIATDLANTISNSRYDEAMRRIVDIIDHLEHPDVDIAAIFTYVIVELFMVFMAGILLAPIAFGFIALGMGSVVWPVFIPWIIVPRLSWLFWNPLTYMLKYSFYRVFAMALTFVFAGIMVQLIDGGVYQDLPNHQYSLAQFDALLLIGMVGLGLVCAWMVIKLPSLVADFFGGSSNAGNSFGSAVVNFARS